MNDTDMIRWLWDHGYFWCPDFPAVLNVNQSDLPTLKLTEKPAIYAMVAAQRADANFDVFVRKHHNRATIADGIVGPATREFLLRLADPEDSLSRCPIPDFVPPPGKGFNYDDPTIQRAVESMQRNAATTGDGSWPHGCHGKSGIHEVTISYDDSNLNTQQKQWLPELKLAAAAAYAAVGVLLTEVPVGQKSNIRFYGQSRGGSIIGVAEFNNETCGDSVFCTIVPSYAPSFVRVLILILHEMGHCMNLQHRSGNIMNPSLLLVEPHWVKRESGLIVYQDNSYPTLRTYFGGGPLVVPSPIPVPTPGPGDPWHGSAILIRRVGEPERRAIVVPLN